MTPERYDPILARKQTGHDGYGFQPWTAEFTNLDYGNSNLTQVIYRFFSLVFVGYDFLADVVYGLRKPRSIEIEAVTVASAVSQAAPVAEDQRAAA